jgi:hypothetical protein
MLDKPTTTISFALQSDVIGTPTSLTLPSDLSQDEWTDIGAELLKAEKSTQWWIGDWWCYGEQKYGERKAKAAAKSWPYAFGTLMNYGSVAGKVAPSLRNEALSFNHHVAVAPLEPRQQKFWLDRAVKGGWSVAKLRQKIQSSEADRNGPEPSDNELALNLYRDLEETADRVIKLARDHRLGKEDVKLIKNLSSERLETLAEKMKQATVEWDKTSKSFQNQIAL